MEARDAAKARSTILIVDDDQDLRLVATRLLERGGYQVIATDDPVEALAIARDERSLALVLTDFAMPRMSGADLAARLNEEHPDVKVVLMSGHGREQVVGRGGRDVPMLAKPFTADSLLSCVARLLDE